MTPSDIKACELHYERRMKKAERLQRKIDAMLPDEIALIAKNPTKWVMDNEEDPTESLAFIYQFAAQYWKDPAQTGDFVKAFLDAKITGVLVVRIERQE